jgi:hypothetical protein
MCKNGAENASNKFADRFASYFDRTIKSVAEMASMDDE